MERKAIKIVRPAEIFAKDNGEKEFYYYQHRSGTRKNYTYRHTFIWKVWKEAVEKIGCTWEDILNHKLQIRVFAYGGISFEKKRGR